MEDGAYHQIPNLDGEVLDAQANRLKTLWQRLTAAQEPDEDDARREYMTRVILVMISLTMGLFSRPILAGWISGLYLWQDAATIILSDTLVFAGLWLALHGHWRKGRFIPLLIIFSLASLITANNGFYNTGLLFYVVGILLTSMLVGIKAQWGMVALSIIVYLVFGWLYERTPFSEISSVAITVSSSFVGIALLQWLLIHLLQQAIQRSRHYAERLEQRAIELVEVNLELQQEITDRERAEKLLRESEERYRTLFENAPIGLALADLEGNIIDFNSAILKPGDYSPEDFEENKSASKLYSNLADRADILAEIKRQGFLEQKEVQFKRKDGAPYDALLSLTPISLEDRTYWQAMVEDITERKQAENALLDLNRALKVLSNCNQAVIRANDETQLLHEICKIITEEGSYHFAWVGYGELNPQGTFRPVAQAGFEAGHLENFPLIEFDTGSYEHPGQKIQTGRLVLGRHVDADPDRIPRRLEDLTNAFADSICLPLIANGRTLGSLNIYSSESGTFQPAEVQLLEKLAANLAFGIATLRTRAQNDQAEQRIQRQLDTMSALRTVDMTITASLDLRFTFDVIL
ncbi:MAG TPA: PAS domain S-box protein, partial [Anaerolineales bacterium]